MWIDLTDLTEIPEQGCLLRVPDGGVGLPSGLDIYHSPTLGLKLVNSLAGQLEVTHEVDRQYGTSVQIMFRDSSLGVDRT